MSKVIHVSPVCDSSRSYEKQRKAHAKQSWLRMPWVGLYVRDEQLQRSAKSIGDRRSLPYVRDVLTLAAEAAGPEGTVVFTNDDVVLHPEIHDRLQQQLQVTGMASAQRLEFAFAHEIPKASPEHWLMSGRHHCGRDLFAFTNEKLKWIIDVMPDMLLGQNVWDWCMLALMHQANNVPVTHSTTLRSTAPTDIPVGYLAHVVHSPQWAHGDDSRSPSKLHNHRLFRSECEKHGWKCFLFDEHGLLAGTTPHTSP
jgi:hypothetical protein